MRDCTADEMDALGRHRCPYCDCTLFRRGPSGGLAVNIECVTCHARFNVTRVDGADDETCIIVFAQCIERADQGGGDWPQRGLW